MSADESFKPLADEIKELRQKGWVNPDSTMPHLLQLLGYDEETRWTDVADGAMSRLLALVAKYAGDKAEKIYLALGVLEGYEYTGVDKLKERREKYFLEGFPLRNVSSADGSSKKDEDSAINYFAKQIVSFERIERKQAEIARIIKNAPSKLDYITPTYPYKDYRGNKKRSGQPATPLPQAEPAATTPSLPMVVKKHAPPRGKPTHKPKQQQKPPKLKNKLLRHKKTATRAAVILLVVLMLSSAFLLLRGLNPAPSIPPEEFYYGLPPNGSILPMITDAGQTANFGPLPLSSEDPTITVSDSAVHNFLVAKTYYERGEFSEALSYLTEALDEQITVSGATSVEVARVYAALGYTYNCLGQYASARDNFNHALAIMSDKNGEYWQEEGRLYYNRALAYQGLYDYDRALDDINEVLRICLDNNPTPDILDYRLSIYPLRGRICLARSDWGGAVADFNTALMMKSLHDPQNSGEHTGPPLYTIRLYEEVDLPAILQHDFYFGDAELAYILCSRGFAYMLVSELDLALADTNMAMEIITGLPNSQQAILSTYYLNMHMIDFQKGSYDSAFAYIDDAISNSQKRLGPQHPYTALMYEYKGISLALLKRYDEALQCHLVAYEAFVELNDQKWMSYNSYVMRTIFEQQQRKEDFEQWLDSQIGG